MHSTRRLAAIIFSDIVGYTSLMSGNEELALSILEKNKRIHFAAIANHKGTLIKEMGDGMLSIFQNTLSAVKCAIEIQTEAREIPHLEIRIGIHAGDIIIEDSDIFGDSVNIAARIEASGKPGCIYVSERVQKEIENQVDIVTEFVGVKMFKNVKYPINIYALVDNVTTPLNLPKREKQNTIAVLPFVNMSPYPEQEYLCDGISEELIRALTNVVNLKVVARTSSFAFKNQSTDIREIGRKLNAGKIVEGSVQKSGNRLRINVQLVDVENGYHLWADRYDRHLEDIFDIQDEIILAIVEQLKSTLRVAKDQNIIRAENMLAYDHYLQGRYYVNQLLPKSIDLAIQCYYKAIDQDPSFSLAYTSLAEAWVLLSTGFDTSPTREAMPKAREAALTSLQLNPSLAEAYVSLGLVAMFHDWNQKLAYDYFQKAIELNPNSVSAYQWVEFYWSFMEGNFNEAMAAIEMVQEVDPLNIFTQVRKGYVYIYRREFQKAIAHFENLVTQIPGFPIGYHCLMDALGQQKQYKEALIAGEKMIELGGKAVANLGVFGFYNALSGQKQKAQEILDDLIVRSRSGYISSFWVGTIFYALEDLDQAFAWYQQAYEERDGNLIYLTTPPQFDALRRDHRFAELLTKMGLTHFVLK